MDNQQVQTRSEIVIANFSGFIGLVIRFIPSNPHSSVEEHLDNNQQIIDQFEAEADVDEQLTTLVAFTKRKMGKKLLTKTVVTLSLKVRPLHHNIFQEMENLIPRAKAHAKSQKRPWFHSMMGSTVG
ncbi:hypothetical protein LINGRAHAP2_LOCUS10022 [Linum grandiflorum]